MASVIRDPGQRFRIQLSQPDGRRSTIRLGKCTKQQANWVKIRVEELDACRRTGMSPSPETSSWLGQIDMRLYKRLASAYLVVPRITPVTLTLAQLCEAMMAELKVKPQTRVMHVDTQASLLKHMRRDTPINQITPEMAEEWRELLLTTYATATVSKQVQRAKQLFNFAVKKGHLAASPFEDVKRGSMRNPDRAYYVDRGTAMKVLAACPDPRWKLIFCMARFGGLRTPSETMGVRFEDVDLQRSQIRVRSPKTAHLDKASRTVPIVPELRQALLEFIESVPPSKRVPGWHLVKPHGGNVATTNLRTDFMRIIKKAGVKPWPRLFQNLRASFQTELQNQFPPHVVCAWLGNTPAVAAEHYLMVRQSDFEKASSLQVVQQP